MAEVLYHQGLTCECDVSIPLLRIEGCPIPVTRAGSVFESSAFPGRTAPTLGGLAEIIVAQSPEFTARKAAKKEHLRILKKGKKAWDAWRRRYPETRPLLYDEDLRFAADLSSINFSNAVLVRANLSKSNLAGANFHETNLGEANLSRANLKGANFCRTDLFRTNLSGADLTNANLQGTQLAGTIFKRATLKNCTIYGLSAWDLKLDGARQGNLKVLFRKEKPRGRIEEGTIIVSDLRSAQFIYLLLHNQAVHDTLDALTSKVVLLLGRFGGGGLEVLQRLRDGLQTAGYVPIIFEFERPSDRTYTETVQTLAGLARFVVVDLSGPSVPQELYATVPHLKIPFVPILEKGRKRYSMFSDLLENTWVLKPVVEFDGPADLLRQLKSKIIGPSERRVRARRQGLDRLYR